ncbi:MAG: DNA mismatch repair protein MutL [Verrucomicrobia bacterium]|nr:MAG: DNA mismatch repair protein MutL [Verrucomicrobiota bacterium]
MGDIRILKDIVASQVAAGEVVERPASIVKELVENSLDAKATRITVEFFQAGIALIRISDDGVGMDREDALLSLERHATSKLSTARDLESISTLGFRGEAIPSIASVSKFRIVTRRREAAAGTEVLVNGGRIEAVRESGEAYGTRVEVRSLFFNVPARRKFLRGPQTEAGHIIHQLHRLAMANPDVAFIALREGKKFLQLAPTKNLAVRVRDLFGLDWIGRLIEGESLEMNGLRIRGFLSQPGRGRADRSEQFIFVNGRPVVTSAVSGPLREVYHTLLPKGYHPGAILFLEMEPALVDCNVHPAKREVRFREPTAIAETVRHFAQQALAKNRSSVLITETREASLTPSAQPQLVEPIKSSVVRNPLQIATLTQTQMVSNAVAAKGAAPLPMPSSPERRKEPQIFLSTEQMEIKNLLDSREIVVIGKIAARFAILEGHFGMVVVDLRAARERILLERLLREMKQGQANAQVLLLPVIIDLPPRDIAWITENIELLERVGISIECFGGASVKVEAIPASLDQANIEQLLVRLIEDLTRGGIRSGNRMAEEAIARSVARLASAEALPTEPERIEALILELLRCELPYSCPMGKATMIPIPLSELKKRFGCDP